MLDLTGEVLIQVENESTIADSVRIWANKPNCRQKLPSFYSEEKVSESEGKYGCTVVKVVKGTGVIGISSHPQFLVSTGPNISDQFLYSNVLKY